MIWSGLRRIGPLTNTCLRREPHLPKPDDHPPTRCCAHRKQNSPYFLSVHLSRLAAMCTPPACRRCQSPVLIARFRDPVGVLVCLLVTFPTHTRQTLPTRPRNADAHQPHDACRVSSMTGQLMRLACTNLPNLTRRIASLLYLPPTLWSACLTWLPGPRCALLEKFATIRRHDSIFRERVGDVIAAARLVPCRR